MFKPSRFRYVKVYKKEEVALVIFGLILAFLAGMKQSKLLIYVSHDIRATQTAATV